MCFPWGRAWRDGGEAQAVSTRQWRTGGTVGTETLPATRTPQFFPHKRFYGSSVDLLNCLLIASPACNCPRLRRPTCLFDGHGQKRAPQKCKTPPDHRGSCFSFRLRPSANVCQRGHAGHRGRGDGGAAGVRASSLGLLVWADTADPPVLT